MIGMSAFGSPECCINSFCYLRDLNPQIQKQQWPLRIFPESLLAVTKAGALLGTRLSGWSHTHKHAHTHSTRVSSRFQIFKMTNSKCKFNVPAGCWARLGAEMRSGINLRGNPGKQICSNVVVSQKNCRNN